MSELQDRVVLVTGATSGIGRATALACAAQGAKVVATGRHVGRGAELIDEIRASGGEATFTAGDMGSEADIARIVATATRVYDGLDYAFNNAGTFASEDLLHQHDDAVWQNMIGVCLTGVYRCMKHEIRAMLETRPDRYRGIVNNASPVGFRGSDRSGPAYTAAKHGVMGLTRQTALAYTREKIRVNAVCPGPTLTAATAPALNQPPEVVNPMLAALNPTGALVSVEEIANTVVFLFSDAAPMINGHGIPLDGGQLAKL